MMHGHLIYDCKQAYWKVLQIGNKKVLDDLALAFFIIKFIYF